MVTSWPKGGVPKKTGSFAPNSISDLRKMTLAQLRKDNQNPLTVLRRVTEGSEDPIAGEVEALKEELRATRDEFRELRELFLERERKGMLLMDAYKSALADFTNLFDLVRSENVKREESVRFLLNAIEGRITEAVRPQSRRSSKSASKPSGGWFKRRR